MGFVASKQASSRGGLRLAAGLPIPIAAEAAPYILKNEVAYRHEDKRDKGGKEHTPCEADAHGENKLGLSAFFKHCRQDSTKGS